MSQKVTSLLTMAFPYRPTPFLSTVSVRHYQDLSEPHLLGETVGCVGRKITHLACHHRSYETGKLSGLRHLKTSRNFGRLHRRYNWPQRHLSVGSSSGPFLNLMVLWEVSRSKVPLAVGCFTATGMASPKP